MKNNKLIAEFMGVEKTYNPSTEKVLSYAVNDDVQCLPHELQYHDSWNWLMPVAKKCINPEDNTEGWDNLAVALTTCNIDEVYQAVVEFIKTYNDGGTRTS
jgi:hypothetical protein|tara:strand:+ start:1449 stop:1751 length:303 start_codon:yes stop_codon:yes gene_type:complete